jgi:hypothetical protein
MKTSIVIIFIFLCSILYACNFSNQASKESKNSLSLEKTTNNKNSFEKRIVEPKTNFEKSNNLWIDLNAYTKYYDKKDSRRLTEMLIPRMILNIGSDSMMNRMDNYFERRNDYDFLSVKSALEEGVFLTTESAILAFVTQTWLYGYKTNSINVNKEIMAESIDNGTTWKFIDILHFKNNEIESFYSEDDSELIHKFLEQSKTNKNLKINELVFRQK